MAHMVSPAGDMDVKMTRISSEGNQLVLEGQIGVWDAHIYFQPAEVAHLARLMLNPSFLKYIVILPFIWLAHMFKRRRGDQA